MVRHYIKLLKLDRSLPLYIYIYTMHGLLGTTEVSHCTFGYNM